MSNLFQTAPNLLAGFIRREENNYEVHRPVSAEALHLAALEATVRQFNQAAQDVLNGRTSANTQDN